MRRMWTRRCLCCDDGELSERGANLAEFALILPLLMVILFGIIEFGLVFSRSQSIEASAREAGRLASLSSTSSADLEARVEATLDSTTFAGAPAVTMQPAGGCAGREGQSVTVTVSAWHRITIPFVLDRDVNLTGESVYRCES